MKHRSSFPHKMNALTDTTDKETNKRTESPSARPSLRWSLTQCVAMKVTTKQLQQWCTLKGGIDAFESSAKEAINVEQIFQAAARKALAQEMQHDQYNDFPDQIQLNANTPSQQPREGCGC